MTPLIAAGLTGLVIFCLTLLLLRALATKTDARTSVPGINRRKEPRVPVNSEFDLFWQDIDASHKSARAKGIEISSRGASVRSSKPILCNSVIQIRALHVPFEGKAIVRRCTRKGLSYVIGVELEGSEDSVLKRRA